jgi:hypothetical protein
VIGRSQTRNTPKDATAFNAAALFGMRVAETSSAASAQGAETGHMSASDPIRDPNSLASQGPSTYGVLAVHSAAKRGSQHINDLPA